MTSINVFTTTQLPNEEAEAAQKGAIAREGGIYSPSYSRAFLTAYTSK